MLPWCLTVTTRTVVPTGAKETVTTIRKLKLNQHASSLFFVCFELLILVQNFTE